MDRCQQISKRINVHRYQGDRYTHLTHLVEVGQSITIDGVGVRFVSRDHEGAAVVSLTGINSRHHMLRCDSFAEWPNTFKSCAHAMQCVHLVNSSHHNSCDEYCASLPGHTCFYAAEDTNIERCLIMSQEACGTNIKEKHGTTDMLCGCAIPGQTAAPRQTTAATPGQTAATRGPVKPLPACPTCGTIKQTGKLSCCAGGGAWVGKCGDPGDSSFDHTWGEGTEACKGKPIGD